MFSINMDNLIVDGAWLWRADRAVSESVYNCDNPVDTGFKEMYKKRLILSGVILCVVFVL